MPTKDVNATTNIQDWNFQQNYVERIMDNAAFTAAHPNNTLVLAGPARLPKENPDDALLPLGMVQQFNVGHNRPTQPMQMIGSGRTFFLSGKGQITFNIGRLWLNGRNLLRALYTSALANGLDVQSFDEAPVRRDNDEQFYLNLDSELFYIPFGMAVLFRSVAHDAVGAFYIELCMLNSWSTGIAAGQNLVMEQVSGVADRIRPIFPDTLVGDTDAPSSETIISTMFSPQEPQPTPNLESK
jgi:hypothetical protein